MYIARNKTTGLYINDFQDKATPDTLIKNASLLGITANDVEVLEVTKEEFDTIVAAEIAPLKAQADADYALTQTELKQIGTAVATTLGLNKAQMKKFILFIRQIDVDTI